MQYGRSQGGEKTMSVILAKATDFFILLLGTGKEYRKELMRTLEDASIAKCSSRIYNNASIFNREFDHNVVIVSAIDIGPVASMIEEDSWGDI
jgi:uncharacterized protein